MLPIHVVSAGGNIQALDSHRNLVLWGFSAAESASSASTAECVIRHGNSTSAPPLFAPMNFAADGFCYPTFVPFPMQCPNGIFVERVSGVTTLILYVDYQ